MSARVIKHDMLNTAALILWFAGVVALGLITHPVCIAGDDERFVIDLDAPPDAENELADSLFYGLEAQLNFERIDNANLDNRDEDDTGVLESQLSLAMAYTPADWFQGFVEIEFIAPFAIDSHRGEPDLSTTLELNQAYAQFGKPSLFLRLGRQAFVDPRQWLFDEDLDAMRLSIGGPLSRVEFSASRDRLYRRDLLNDDDDEKVNRYLLTGRHTFDSGILLNSYVLVQDERGGDEEDPVFFGVYAGGVLNESINSWFNAAYIDGQSDGVDIQAWGVDLGLTLVADWALNPSLTLAFAHGSGDDDPDDGIDQNFRQTGIHENEAAFGGVIAFNYYGAALAPELSNLFVYTAGIGIKPTLESSIDLVYHYYRLDEIQEDLRDANIEAELDGDSRDLGHGLDLVMGGEFGDMEIELILGGFLPGKAFSNSADPAWFMGVEVVYEF